MNNRKLAPGILLAAAVVLALLAPLACPLPDGLEKVAAQCGFMGRAKTLAGGLLPDYAVPGMGEGALPVIAAGIAGIALVFAVAAGLGMLLGKKGK